MFAYIFCNANCGLKRSSSTFQFAALDFSRFTTLALTLKAGKIAVYVWLLFELDEPIPDGFEFAR